MVTFYCYGLTNQNGLSHWVAGISFAHSAWFWTRRKKPWMIVEHKMAAYWGCLLWQGPRNNLRSAPVFIHRLTSNCTEVLSEISFTKPCHSIAIICSALFRNCLLSVACTALIRFVSGSFNFQLWQSQSDRPLSAPFTNCRVPDEEAT